MSIIKCSPEGMAWWITAVLANKGLPVGQDSIREMIRTVAIETYQAGGLLACEVNSPMQQVMLQHGPRSSQAQAQPMQPPPPVAHPSMRPVQNAQGMPLGPNSVPPAQRHPQPTFQPPTAPPAQRRPVPGTPMPQNNPGLIENYPGQHVPLEAPVFDSDGDAPPSMTNAPEPVIDY